MRKIKLLNLSILSISRNELLERMKFGVLFTPNVDQLVKLQNDIEFYKTYQKSDWVICDSKILNLGAKFLGKSFKEVIPGSSLFPVYCDYHKDNLNIKIFLLGGAPNVANLAMQRINNRIGRAIVVGSHSPSFGFENDLDECNSIVDLINKSEASVLVVGVGAPKQEKWIIKYKNDFTKINLFMALGATIDFEAGNIKRAPLWMQKVCLEWMYRLIKEPKRMWKRYLIDDLPFFYLLLKDKLGLYNNPFN